MAAHTPGIAIPPPRSRSTASDLLRDAAVPVRDRDRAVRWRGGPDDRARGARRGRNREGDQRTFAHGRSDLPSSACPTRALGDLRERREDGTGHRVPDVQSGVRLAEGDPPASAQGGARDRRQRLLRAPRRRRRVDRSRVPRQPLLREHRAGRFDDHPAAGEDRPDRRGSGGPRRRHVRPQAAGGGSRAADGGEVHEERDPRAVSERGVPG